MSSKKTMVDSDPVVRPLPSGNNDLLSLAMRWGFIALLVAAAVVACLGALLKGHRGVWGGVLGVLTGYFFMTVTIISIRLSTGRDPATRLSIILGSWIGKVVVVLGLLIFLKTQTFLSHLFFALGVGVSLILALGVDSYLFLRTKIFFDSEDKPHLRDKSSE